MSPDLHTFLATIDHPHRARLLGLHERLLAEGDLTASVKWNAPSYAHEGRDRATFRLRPRDTFQLILHRGAAKTGNARPAVDDPHGLLEWKDEDRAVLDLTNASDEQAVALLRSWVANTT